MIESEALKKWCPMTRVAKIERGRVPFGQVACQSLAGRRRGYRDFEGVILSRVEVYALARRPKRTTQRRSGGETSYRALRAGGRGMSRFDIAMTPRLLSLPCAIVSAPRFDARACRSVLQCFVSGASWLPADAHRPAEQDIISRAHRLTEYSRQRAARGAIPNRAYSGRTRNRVRGVSRKG